AAFLAFSKSRGNDLSTPMPEFGFPGLKPGDRWCLCAPRWQEALEADQAPRVVLRATHEGALSYCSLADLKRFAVDLAWGWAASLFSQCLPSLFSQCPPLFALRTRQAAFPASHEKCTGWLAGRSCEAAKAGGRCRD